MKTVITISAPLSIQVHVGNPRMARIPELDIRSMPESEGGGWYMPTSQAEALVGAWNGFINLADDDAKCLPTWAQLTAYWKARAESEGDADIRLAGFHKALFEELGEPEYKLARWNPGSDPWHYWSREAIESALASVIKAGS